MEKSCEWPGSDALMKAYHDTEWGVPLHDDQKLFEFLVLEGFQAGLSWAIVLKKREAFRKAFDGFDPSKVVRFTSEDIERLMQNPEIIRNRRKIEATINNARCFLRIQEEFGSFDRYIWEFVNFKPVVNQFETLAELPARTPLSDLISKDLIRRGFKFAGSTIVYAHMQATGMVNDHMVHCHRYKDLLSCY
jgi:DNA-3-methyladenine glycosylase I